MTIKGCMPPTEALLKHLKSLGYFQDDSTAKVSRLKLKSNKVREEVARYQDMHGLNKDGWLGPKTAAHMTLPRCGMPDVLEANASLRQWPRSCMENISTAHRLSSLRPLSSEIEHRAWMEAIESWNKVCGINLTYTEDYGSANIRAEVGGTDGSVLAWSYLPSNRCGQQLQQRYGSQWTWSFAKLKEVIVHEVGHALGLPHGPSSSIMNATALGKYTTPQEWDIEQVRKRYGPPKEEPEPPEPPGDGIIVASWQRAGDTYEVVVNGGPDDNDGGVGPFG